MHNCCHPHLLKLLPFQPSKIKWGVLDAQYTLLSPGCHCSMVSHSATGLLTPVICCFSFHWIWTLWVNWHRHCSAVDGFSHCQYICMYDCSYVIPDCIPLHNLDGNLLFNSSQAKINELAWITLTSCLYGLGGTNKGLLFGHSRTQLTLRFGIQKTWFMPDVWISSYQRWWQGYEFRFSAL